MKFWKKLIIVFIVLLVLCIPAFFMYTRFCLEIYKIKDNTVILKNNIYVQSGGLSITDEKNLGKTIGIASQLHPTLEVGACNSTTHGTND